jgi:hypothetical protein
MRFRHILLAAIFLLGLAGFSARAADLETQLIWATRDSTSPNPKHRAVDADVARKLAGLPLGWKWSHFFMENRRGFAATSVAQRIELSPKCAVEVSEAGNDRVNVALYGNGRLVWRGVQPLPHGEILVLGGNAPGDNAWVVTLKRKD